MKHCPFCAEEIQDAAIKCRFCGSDLVGHAHAPTRTSSVATVAKTRDGLSPAGKVAAALAVIGFLTIAALISLNQATLPSSESGPANSPRPVQVQEEQAIQLSAITLVDAYEDNEVNADRLYKGRILVVDGVVDAVGKDIIDSPYVALKGSHLWSAQAYFGAADEPQLAALTKGQRITVRCRCEGKFGNVLLKNCAIR